MDGQSRCRCGHPHDSHDHYRPGTDCAVCGRWRCPRYRPAPWWRRLRRLR